MKAGFNYVQTVYATTASNTAMFSCVNATGDQKSIIQPNRARVGESRRGCPHSPGQGLSHHPPAKLLHTALTGTQDDHWDRQKTIFPAARKRAELTLVRTSLLSSPSHPAPWIPASFQALNTPAATCKHRAPRYSAHRGTLAVTQLATDMGQPLPSPTPGEPLTSSLVQP